MCIWAWGAFLIPWGRLGRFGCFYWLLELLTLLGGAAGAVYIGCWLVMKLALNGIQDSGRAVDFFVIFFNEIIKAAAPPAWPPGAPQSPRELHTRTCPHRTSKFIQICVGFNSSRRTSSYKWLPSRRSAPRRHRRRRRHGGSQIRKAIHK